mmetsp:Transcript_69725/g.185975  ORF Transcript_69725/g.185975 Transcript_69725/m.185975 type:complete len:111 (-) Transcript_69725:229-561(-)
MVTGTKATGSAVENQELELIFLSLDRVGTLGPGRMANSWRAIGNSRTVAHSQAHSREGSRLPDLAASAFLTETSRAEGDNFKVENACTYNISDLRPQSAPRPSLSVVEFR